MYDRARAFVYPSTFEGFGMPVLEAMAAGIPLACSDIPPLREVAGDAALFFDPLNEDAIASAIERDDERRAFAGTPGHGGPRTGAADLHGSASRGANARVLLER